VSATEYGITEGKSLGAQDGNINKSVEYFNVLFTKEK
jgi:hypothetical protein